MKNASDSRMNEVATLQRRHAVNLNSNCLDILRYICAITVFFGHYLTHFGIDNQVLHEVAYFVRGVPVFFFLSGLFIARSLERYDIKEYLFRRVARIFPELWTCVTLNLVPILISLGGAALLDLLIYFATQLTVFQFYTGEWLKGYGTGTPNGALWTITVDLQFYIVAIFIAKIMNGRSPRSWSCTIAGLMLADLVLEKTSGLYPSLIYKLLMVSLLPFLWIFMVGMAVYYFKDSVIPAIVRLKYPILILYAVWQLLATKGLLQPFQGIRYNLVTTALLLLMVTSVGFSFNRRLKRDYSYSFYLYHMVTMNFAIEIMGNHLSSPAIEIAMLIILFGTTAVLAILSHELIAIRFTRSIEKKLDRRSATSCPGGGGIHER